VLKLILVVSVLALVAVVFWPDISQLFSSTIVDKVTPYIHDGQQLINSAKGL
jgi:hypothetical protein